MCLEKVIVNKWPNGTTEVVEDIKYYHADQENSYSLVCFYSLIENILVIRGALKTLSNSAWLLN